MKLPGIQYGRGAPSLGRVGNENVQARLAKAQTAQDIAGEVDRYQQRKTAHEVAMANAGLVEWETGFQKNHDGRETYEADELPSALRKGDGDVPAFEVRGELYAQEFESNLSEISSRITDPRARENWLLGKRAIGEQKKAERFVRREREQRDYYNKETLSKVDGLLDDGLYSVATQLIDNLDAPGFEKEAIRDKIEIRQTDDTINRMIAQGDVEGLKGMRAVLKSKDYDGAYKNEAKLKTVVAEIEREIDQLTEIERKQQLADLSVIETNKIFHSGKSHSEQLVQARLISNADLRDEVVKELKVRHAEEVAREKRVKEEDSKTFWDAFRANPSPSLLVFAPDASTEVAARQYMNQVAKGVPIETDKRKYYELQVMMANEPRKFIELNMMNYVGYLSEGDFQEMVKLQATAKRTGSEALSGVNRYAQETKELLGRMGLDSAKLTKRNGDRERVVADLYRDEINYLTTEKGREPSYSERQAIQDRIMMDFTQQGLFFDSTYDLSDVPEDKISEYADILRRNGAEVTGAAIAEMYKDDN